MKLLSWMHRKLQKDTTSSLQASVHGNSCLCFLVTPSKDTKQIWQQTQHYEDQVHEFNPENTKEFNEEHSTHMFPGFLTIGTLNVETISEPPTPTFDMPHQEDNEEMTEMKYDLKLINDELEKFLKVEAEKVGSTGMSRKNSEVSIITLSQDAKEDASDQSFIKTQLYPLQGYLLGSSIEPLEKTPKAKKEKTSLNKLFKNCKTMNRKSIKAAGRTTKEDTEEMKSSNHLMNKMQQPTEANPHMSYHSIGHAAESFLTLGKLKKINQLFHKKIHPETSKAELTAKESKPNKYGTKKNHNTDNSYVDLVFSSGKSTIGCWGIQKKGKKHCSKTHLKLPQDATTKQNLDHVLEDISYGAGKEHWIRTDEEYFVLELQQN